MAASTKIKPRDNSQVTVSFSDSINLGRQQVQWSPKGVSLLTKWPFAVGAEIEFAFDHQGERHSCAGVVVACRPLPKPENHYETVLYFVQSPCAKALKAACECKLAEAEHYPQG